MNILDKTTFNDKSKSTKEILQPELPRALKDLKQALSKRSGVCDDSGLTMHALVIVAASVGGLYQWIDNCGPCLQFHYISVSNGRPLINVTRSILMECGLPLVNGPGPGSELSTKLFENGGVSWSVEEFSLLRQIKSSSRSRKGEDLGYLRDQMLRGSCVAKYVVSLKKFKEMIGSEPEETDGRKTKVERDGVIAYPSHVQISKSSKDELEIELSSNVALKGSLDELLLFESQSDRTTLPGNREFSLESFKDVADCLKDLQHSRRCATLTNKRFKPKEILFAGDAQKMLCQVEEYYHQPDELGNDCVNNDRFWKSGVGLVRTLSQLFAICENPTAPKVTVEHVSFAHQLVRLSKHRLYELWTFDSKQKEIAHLDFLLEKIEESGTISREDLRVACKRLKIKSVELDSLISTLRASGNIRIVQEKSERKRGRKTIYYEFLKITGNYRSLKKTGN